MRERSRRLTIVGKIQNTVFAFGGFAFAVAVSAMIARYIILGQWAEFEMISAWLVLLNKTRLVSTNLTT